MPERVVLITGCSSGFGRAMAGAFRARGWTVVATARRASARGLADALDLDVTCAAERDAAAAHLRARHGRLDCLVNNAGAAVFGAVEDVAPDQLRAQVEVNYLGPALLTRALLPLLRPARGRVICVSSMLAETAFPLTAAYGAAKAALENFAEALRHEVAPHGVQIAVVAPGRHRTDFARNAAWGAATGDGASPYRAQSQGYARMKAALAGRPAPGPDAVARTVVALAERRRMPFRVRAGADARAAHLLRRFLPEPVALALWGALAARLLRARAPAPGAAGAVVERAGRRG
jgi:NAD(P)-dependent dehydrogenase (short-subunit alcohol dehydrogenase family)